MITESVHLISEDFSIDRMCHDGMLIQRIDQLVFQREALIAERLLDLECLQQRAQTPQAAQGKQVGRDQERIDRTVVTWTEHRMAQSYLFCREHISVHRQRVRRLLCLPFKMVRAVSVLT